MVVYVLHSNQIKDFVRYPWIIRCIFGCLITFGSIDITFSCVFLFCYFHIPPNLRTFCLELNFQNGLFSCVSSVPHVTLYSKKMNKDTCSLCPSIISSLTGFILLILKQNFSCNMVKSYASLQYSIAWTVWKMYELVVIVLLQVTSFSDWKYLLAFLILFRVQHLIYNIAKDSLRKKNFPLFLLMIMLPYFSIFLKICKRIMNLFRERTGLKKGTIRCVSIDIVSVVVLCIIA